MSRHGHRGSLPGWAQARVRKKSVAEIAGPNDGHHHAPDRQSIKKSANGSKTKNGKILKHQAACLLTIAFSWKSDEGRVVPHDNSVLLAL